MTKIRCFAAIFLLSLGLIQASCVTTSKNADRPEDFSNTQSIFWEVSKNQQQHFLMGTLHIGVSLADLPPAVLAQLGSSQNFIGELSSFEIEPELMKKYTFLPSGQKLGKLIGQSYVDKFVAILDEKKFPYQAELIEQLSLYSVYSTMLVVSSHNEAVNNDTQSNEQAPSQQKFNSEVHPLVQEIDQSGLPIDLKLASLASNQGLQIRGFETIEDQLKMFQDFCTAEKIQALIDHKEEAKEVLQNLSLAYQNSSRDESKEQDPFAAIMVAMLRSMTAADRQLLLYDRNHLWIKKFEKLTKGRSSFIAVGAGHIPGEQGLVELLRKQGYLVRPVFFQQDKSPTADLR